jgi:hypothetical protein
VGKWMIQAKHGFGDDFGLRTGQSHHPNAAATGRRGNGNNGVVQVHGTSFEFPVPSCKSSYKTAANTRRSTRMNFLIRENPR